MSEQCQQHKMIILTAPSGAGKTTIVKHLLETFDGTLSFSVSATTRPKRPNELEGGDYYFLSVESFHQKIKEGAFVEWEEVYKNQFYGTLKSEVSRLWNEQKVVAFDVDVEGATRIKAHYGDQCLAIFVEPPSMEVHLKRLKSRGTESEEALNKRIAKIKREMLFRDRFDTIIVNDILEVALMEAELLVKQFIGLDTDRIIAC